MRTALIPVFQLHSSYYRQLRDQPCNVQLGGTAMKRSLRKFLPRWHSKNLKPFLPLFCLVLCFAITLSCGKKQAPPLLPAEPPSEEPIEDDSLGNLLDDGKESGGSSGMTPAEDQALKSLLKETEAIAPESGDSAVSAALQQEMQNILKEEAEGRDVAMQKMALAGKMMKECAEKVAGLAPKPGQPLLGEWKGDKCKSPSFTLRDTRPKGLIPGQNQNQQNSSGGGGASQQGDGILIADGKIEGKVSPGEDGSGKFTSTKGTWSGTLYDNGLDGLSGAGKLTNPKYSKTKYGTKACTANFTLEASTNPIPENYVEAMKIAGNCFRRALIMMSPVMDKMFKGMDPAMRTMLQQSMLGGGSSSSK